MFSFVKAHGHYTEEEMWDMTLPRLQMDFYFAMKYIKVQAQYTGAACMGATLF